MVVKPSASDGGEGFAFTNRTLLQADVSGRMTLPVTLKTGDLRSRTSIPEVVWPEMTNMGWAWDLSSTLG